MVTRKPSLGYEMTVFHPQRFGSIRPLPLLAIPRQEVQQLREELQLREAEREDFSQRWEEQRRQLLHTVRVLRSPLLNPPSRRQSTRNLRLGVFLRLFLFPLIVSGMVVLRMVSFTESLTFHSHATLLTLRRVAYI